MKTHHHPNRALSQKELEARRLRAVPYFKKGWSLRRIAHKFGVSFIAVRQWKAAWKENGAAGLRAGRYGPRSKLSAREAKKVSARIQKGAAAYGFSGDFWTLSRLTNAVRAWTGVAYHDRSIWHVLKRLGFSCQKPVKRAVERDERAIKTWLSTTWPKVKKGALETA
jgi:transposase